MTWTTANAVKAQLTRLWDRGELLRPLVSGEMQFPLRLSLKVPNSAELADRFEAVRAWVTELVAAPYLRIEWREVNHRVLGLQRLPQSIWIDRLDDAAALIGKRVEIASFAELLTLTTSQQPVLLEWITKRPLQALALAKQWPHLLAVVDWLIKHPRPAVYLRQADIGGVHSKFIEAHRGVLGELFDLALPSPGIAFDKTGVSQFAARYGFLDKPIPIRFRVLDERMHLLPGPLLPDITLDADSFVLLDIPVRRVFITENETNFLAFPPVAEAIVIFGKGYGWDALAQAGWLKLCTIHYWGDIDTHGFAILNQLRSRFAHVESLLMDRPTLMKHEAIWGVEDKQVMHDLPGLTSAEKALFDALRDNHIRKNLRLEQEHIGFQWVIAALDRIADD